MFSRFDISISTGLRALGLSAMLLASVPSAGLAETFNLKIASGNAPGFHFVDFTREFFLPELKKRVAERTSHRINVLEGWGGVIAKPTEVLESTQSGVIDFGLFCYCHEGDKLRLHNFPYFAPFSSTDPVIALRATRKVYDETPELARALEVQYNQRLLTLIPFDTYDLISTFPIRGSADLKGRRVGGAGPNLPWVERVGATPVTTTGPEVYTSLSSGVYSALLAFVTIMDAAKLYDVAPHYTQVGFGAKSVLALHINNNSFQRLPPEVQAIVLEVARDFEGWAAEATRQLYDRRVAEIAQKGAKVATLSADQKKIWAEALATFPREKAAELDKAGLPGTQVLKRFIAASTAGGHTWPVDYQIGD